MPGPGDLTLTGLLGDVMRSRSGRQSPGPGANAGRYGLDAAVFRETDLHVHAQSAVAPKDGASAGVTQVSSFTRRPVRADLTITGEDHALWPRPPGRWRQREGARCVAARADPRGPASAEREALAYRCGNRCVDAYTGIEHDYSRRSARREIYNSAIVGPGADFFGGDVAVLTTAIDSRETRRNACLGRDVDIALPCELSEEQQWTLLEEIGIFIGRRYETPVLIALHRAPVEGDARNNHGHGFVPSRRFENGEFTSKLRQLDDRRRGAARVQGHSSGNRGADQHAPGARRLRGEDQLAAASGRLGRAAPGSRVHGHRAPPRRGAGNRPCAA